MDSRAVQRLVDVDIAQTRDYALIEQRLLDRDAAAMQARREVVASEGVAAGSLGSESECPQRGVDSISWHQPPPAELPDVAVVGDCLGEAQGEMGRLVRIWSLGIGHGMTRDNSRAVRPQHAQADRPA